MKRKEAIEYNRFTEELLQKRKSYASILTLVISPSYITYNDSPRIKKKFQKDYFRKIPNLFSDSLQNLEKIRTVELVCWGCIIPKCLLSHTIFIY